MVNYNGVAIEITRDCPLNCPHCCNGGKSDCGQEMPVDRMEQILSNLKGFKDLVFVSFTGGEPFVDIPRLEQCVQVANRLGYKISTISSGFWAKDLRKCRDILWRLKKFGLSSLTLSLDAYHLAYVPKSNFVHVVRSASDMDLPISLQIAIAADTDFNVVLCGLEEILTTARVELIRTFPTGNAANFPRDSFIRSIPPHRAKCEKGTGFFINCEGELYPCCSPFAHECHFHLGNVIGRSGSEIRAKLEKNRLLSIIRHFGFAPFLNFVRQTLHLDFPEKLTTGCEICRLLFSEQGYAKSLMYSLELESKLKSKEGL